MLLLFQEEEGVMAWMERQEHLKAGRHLKVHLNGDGGEDRDGQQVTDQAPAALVQRGAQIAQPDLHHAHADVREV